MKNKIKFLLKAVAAMISAFILLNLASVFYYNIPIHTVSKTQSTDHAWEKNKFYSRGTEGFAYGVTDDNGYNNLKTYEEGEIDVLVMGSSHMEAFNVAQSKNTTAVLNKMFEDYGVDLNAYNIGISSHNFVRCLNNLGNAIQEFKPQKYVIIETQTIKPNVVALQQVLNGEFPTIEVNNGGLLGTLQKFPYLRLLYSQLSNFKSSNDNKPAPQNNDEKILEERNIRAQLLNENLKRSKQICEEAGVELIIFYNCAIDIDDEGNVVAQKDAEDVELFNTICENNDIIFINMYDSFKENYQNTHKLPRGFSNTKVGDGHLNEEGHRVIAEELFSVICK